MTRIECSRCGDMLEIEARSLMLPYVCDGCRTVEAELNVCLDDDPSFETQCFLDADEERFQCIPENEVEVYPESSHETTENTTIADLERQLVGYRELDAASQEYIRSLEESVERSRVIIDYLGTARWGQ